MGWRCRLLKVDSDLEPRIASALKVYGLPTIFLMKVRMHSPTSSQLQQAGNSGPMEL